MKRLLLIALALLGAAPIGCSEKNEFVEPPPPPVTTAVPVVQTVPVYLEENGETEAVERAEVRPEVKGILEEVRFVQGQSVKKGDVLYVIEKTDYEAAYQAEAANLKATEASVNVAEAAKKTAEVAQVRTELELNRQKKLFAEKATAETNVEQASNSPVNAGALATASRTPRPAPQHSAFAQF